MSSPLISVIIPCYNAGMYLEQAVNSILSQKGVTDLEVVIVDDGSTDESRAIAAELMQVDSRVRLVEKPNGGVCSAVNAGLSVSHGSIIALCGADDWWAPNKLKLQLPILESNPGTVLVFSDLAVVDAMGNMLYPSYWRWARLRPESGRPLGKLIRGNFVSGSTVLFRRDYVSWALPIPKDLPFEDWWLAVAAVLTGDIACVPQQLVFYRLHDKNLVLKAPQRPTRSELVRDLRRATAYLKALVKLLDRDEIRPDRSSLGVSLQVCRQLLLAQADRLSWRMRRLENGIGCASIVLPLLGATSVRDAIGRLRDITRDIRILLTSR